MDGASAPFFYVMNIHFASVIKICVNQKLKILITIMLQEKCKKSKKTLVSKITTWHNILIERGEMVHPTINGVKIMNAVAISAAVESAARTGLRVVKVTSLRGMTADSKFFAELHDAKGTILPIHSAAFNTENPVKAWAGNDGVSVTIMGRGVVEFVAHGMKGPAYPVAKIIGPRGHARNVRVTFYAPADAPVTATEKGMAAKPEIVDAEIIEPAATLAIAAPVETVTATPAKPKKEDYATFGEWMKACRERKAAMREMAVDV